MEVPTHDLPQTTKVDSPAGLKITVRGIQNQTVHKITAIAGLLRPIPGPVLPEQQVLPAEAILPLAMVAAIVLVLIQHQAAVLAEVVEA